MNDDTKDTKNRVVIAYFHIAKRVRLSRSMSWVRVPAGHTEDRHRIGKNASLLGMHPLG